MTIEKKRYVNDSLYIVDRAFTHMIDTLIYVCAMKAHLMTHADSRHTWYSMTLPTPNTPTHLCTTSLVHVQFQNLKKRVVLQTALLREHALVQNRHNRNRGSTSDLQDRDANENAAGPTHNGSALGYNAHLYYEAGDAGVSFKRMAQELISAHLPPASAKRGGDKKDNRDNNDDIDDNNSNGNTADHDEHDNIDDNDDDDNGDNRTSSASYTPLQQDLLSLQSIISQQESYAHRQASHIHHTTTQIQELKSTLHSERRYTQRLRHLNDKQTQYLDQQSRGLRMSKEELVSLKVLEVKTHASLPFPLTCASSSTSSNARGKTQGYMLGGVSVQLVGEATVKYAHIRTYTCVCDRKAGSIVRAFIDTMALTVRVNICVVYFTVCVLVCVGTIGHFALCLYVERKQSDYTVRSYTYFIQ